MVDAIRDRLVYLKAVIEGQPNIERWTTWFSANAPVLKEHLTRTEFLRLKLHRIDAIPEILTRFGVAFVRSDEYAWLAGMPGRCRDCGATTVTSGNFTWCPKGCFRLHALPQRDSG
jgi:hypothetical protein